MDIVKRPRRKAIPRIIKAKVAARQMWLTTDWHPVFLCMHCRMPLTGDIEYDHRPSLVLRPMNASGTDYKPPQLDPNYIEALHPACHQKRTTGRLPGAKRTITTKGSDIGIAAKFRRLERPKKRKVKIPSRPFQKGSKFR